VREANSRTKIHLKHCPVCSENKLLTDKLPPFEKIVENGWKGYDHKGRKTTETQINQQSTEGTDTIVVDADLKTIINQLTKPELEH
jgi:hypothetical protein